MKYHTRITFLCYNFGKKFIHNGLINSFKECPISLSHLKDIREDDYKYKPDAYFIKSSDKRYITFQVLSSQGKKPKEIVGDILNAILTFQIKEGYFIVKSKEDYKRVNNLLKISYSILQDIYMLKKSKDLPNLKVVLIKEEWNDKQINEILNDISKKDKWTK